MSDLSDPPRQQGKAGEERGERSQMGCGLHLLASTICAMRNLGVKNGDYMLLELSPSS